MHACNPQCKLESAPLALIMKGIDASKSIARSFRIVVPLLQQIHNLKVMFDQYTIRKTCKIGERLKTNNGEY